MCWKFRLSCERDHEYVHFQGKHPTTGYMDLGLCSAWWLRICLPMQETGLMPELEGSLEKKMVTHSSILAWEISWTERGAWRAIVHESQRVGYNLAIKHQQQLLRSAA